MKLSIITICYNIKDEIERTCQSIVAQTNQDFEWIVVDGGSTDGTKEILEKYKERINIFISEPDTGIYNAMNKGIKKASGEYLNFMNGGDSFASADVIEKFYNADIQNADVIYGNMNFIKKNGKKVLRSYPEHIDKIYLVYHCINHQSSFIRKTLFEQYGQYNENYKIVSDWEKWIVFIENSCVFRHWNETVADFQDGGVGSVTTSRLIKERESVLAEYFTEEELKHIIEICKNVKMKFYLFHVIPFYKIVKTYVSSSYYLFGLIPIYKIKKKTGKSKHYLFNFLPIYKIKKNINKSKHYLFGFIPFLKIKEK
ncbi:MAG: glycosyltransferase [Alphaproteobacteria bacterium]|nr:glycosyltransferase [Alphaproteobacteria bacterium]